MKIGCYAGITRPSGLCRKEGSSSMISSSICNYQISRLPRNRHISCNIKNLKPRSTAKDVDSQTEEEFKLEQQQEPNETTKTSIPTSSALDANLKKAVQKTAATFAPRASTASRNPAVPGSTLYSVFEIQGYISMLLGGALSFNLIFPSNEPDLWRLMGMWSIWMFTIPSLRARDCSKKEKEALNYLFILVPLINVLIPFFYKSFAVVWSADTFAFFGMYAWKMGWLQKTE
ncbi:Protein RESISTANCE TO PHYTOPHTHORA 1 chloroplastic [Euphorbia peplus]|nr:Protein RESISTANCE TO PHYTOPHTHORA 1 chloroplastic [Euphorbia peplus]